MDIQEVREIVKNGLNFSSKKGKEVSDFLRSELEEKIKTHYPDLTPIPTNVLKYFLFEDRPPLCPICTSPCDTKEKGTPFKIYCKNKECMHKGRAKTYEKNMLVNYGVKNAGQVEEYKEKRNNTVREKYGKDNVSQVKEFSEKRIETFKESGRSGPLSGEAAKRKYEETCIERFGTKWAASSDAVKSKRRDTLESLPSDKKSEYARKGHETRRDGNKKAYDVLKDKDQLECLYNTGLSGHAIASKLGVHGQTVYNYLNKHGVEIRDFCHTSSPEIEIAEFVESLGFEVERNVKGLLDPNNSLVEIDVYVPALRFGIEHNGIRYHSTKFKKEKARNYHKNKHDLAENIGIDLLSVWEDDWLNPTKRSIIEKSIAHKLGTSGKGIYARKTKVNEFPKWGDVVRFMEETHIQGFAHGTTPTVLNDEYGNIVACMLTRKKGNGVIEVSRYASSGVVGGFSKCLKNAIKKYPDAEMVVTYADRMMSNGSLYEATGFRLDGITPTSYMYTEGHYRENKQNFRKSKLKERFENYDDSLSESEIAASNGFYQIYDAGLKRYVMDLT